MKAVASIEKEILAWHKFVFDAERPNIPTPKNLTLMDIRRTVPNIKSANFEESHFFFNEFLGMNVAMEMEQIVTFASPNNPTAQISIIGEEQADAPVPHISIEVENVDEMYERARHKNIEIVYPIRNEPWGVRRFFVRFSENTIINILSHI